MNNVGAQGRGESVWLGFFLYEVLTRFGRLADRQGDTDVRAALPGSRRRRCARISSATAGTANGIGARTSTTARRSVARRVPECRIDSVSQSWSVLSGAGEPARARRAMDAVDRHLVKREHALIQLLDPPFDKAAWDPGYIRGYVPGVRENGGQYTHGAIWAAMAFAALRDAKRAWELFAMINPINHTRSPEALATYRAEPYVVAADVYAVAPHTGRGGWSWYTGSAGWMYRLILESLLGIVREDDRLRFNPCLPAHWTSCEIRYRYGDTPYRITLRQVTTSDVPAGVRVDGVVRPDRSVPPLAARFGLLLRRVVDLLEHPGNGEQERRLERAERRQQLLGVGLVARLHTRVDREDRDEARKDVRGRDEQQRGRAWRLDDLAQRLCRVAAELDEVAVRQHAALRAPC